MTSVPSHLANPLRDVFAALSPAMPSSPHPSFLVARSRRPLPPLVASVITTAASRELDKNRALRHTKSSELRAELPTFSVLGAAFRGTRMDSVFGDLTPAAPQDDA